MNDCSILDLNSIASIPQPTTLSENVKSNSSPHEKARHDRKSEERKLKTEDTSKST
jgi:hypothetical protein